LKVTFKFGLADNPIVRNRKSKDRQYNDKQDKGQTMIYKTPQKKVYKLGSTRTSLKPGTNPGAPKAFPA
jgi:hypothetical protein